MSDELMVYVVDDDEAVLHSAKAVLASRGHQTRCFISAELFLTQAAIDRPGCVVADLQMPGVDGCELQRRLNDSASPLSLVVVTGVADVPTAVRLMENGAVTLLEKPYDPDVLLKAVAKALDESQGRWHKARESGAVKQRMATLSDEEHQVLSKLLAGDSHKSVAQSLDLSHRTVDRRRRAILEKMGVSSLPALAALLGASLGSGGVATPLPLQDGAKPQNSESGMV